MPLISIEDNGQVFYIDVDFQEMKKKASERRLEYEESYHTTCHSDEQVTLEDWTSDCDSLDEDILELESNLESLKEAVRVIGKKKNGWFRIGAVNLHTTYGSLAEYWEDSYGWNTTVIKFKAISDNTCTLKVTNEVIKY